MTLPLVLVVLMICGIVMASFSEAARRAAVLARQSWDMARAEYAAEAAVESALANWRAADVAARPIGQEADEILPEQAPWRVWRRVVRTGPLVAVLSAGAERWVGGRARVRRDVRRVVYLRPPALPLLAAATVLGPLRVGGAQLAGSDTPQQLEPDRDDCGPARDTLRVADLAAGVPVIDPVPPLLRLQRLTTADRQQAHAAFDAALRQVRRLADPVTMGGTGVLPLSPAWRPVVMGDTAAVTLAGDQLHVGLLAVETDLYVHGRLHIDGVLAVRGRLVVDGVLDVHGAVVVDDAAERGSTLGALTTVRYDRCLVGRALAGAAIPTESPFRVWQWR